MHRAGADRCVTVCTCRIALAARVRSLRYTLYGECKRGKRAIFFCKIKASYIQNTPLLYTAYTLARNTSAALQLPIAAIQ